MSLSLMGLIWSSLKGRMQMALDKGKTGDPIKKRFEGVCQHWCPPLGHVFASLGSCRSPGAVAWLQDGHLGVPTPPGTMAELAEPRPRSECSSQSTPGPGTLDAALAPREQMNKCAGMSGRGAGG